MEEFLPVNQTSSISIPKDSKSGLFSSCGYSTLCSTSYYKYEKHETLKISCFHLGALFGKYLFFSFLWLFIMAWFEICQSVDTKRNVDHEGVVNWLFYSDALDHFYDFWLWWNWKLRKKDSRWPPMSPPPLFEFEVF